MNTFIVIPHMIWFPDPPPSSLLNMFQLAVNFSPKKWCLGLNSALPAWPAASEVTLLIPLIGRYITSHRVYNWVRGSVADPCSWVAWTYTKTSVCKVLHLLPDQFFIILHTRNWLFESKCKMFFIYPVEFQLLCSNKSF